MFGTDSAHSTLTFCEVGASTEGLSDFYALLQNENALYMGQYVTLDRCSSHNIELLGNHETALKRNSLSYARQELSRVVYKYPFHLGCLLSCRATVMSAISIRFSICLPLPFSNTTHFSSCNAPESQYLPSSNCYCSFYVLFSLDCCKQSASHNGLSIACLPIILSLHLSAQCHPSGFTRIETYA